MNEENSSTGQSTAATEADFAVEDSSAASTLRLMDILLVMAKRKFTILVVTGAAMVAGVVISLLLPVRYTATIKIMTPQQNQSAAGLMNQMNGGGVGAMSLAASSAGLMLKNPNDLYIGLMNSQPIADTIIRKFGLASKYHAPDMTAARKILARSTKISSEKSGFIAVSATDTDKHFAADLANAYVEGLRTQLKTLAVTEASQRRLFFEEQLKQAKEDLVSAEAAFKSIQQKKGLVQLDMQARAAVEGLSAIRAQIAAKQVQLQALRFSSTEQNAGVQVVERELATLQEEENRLDRSSSAQGDTAMGLQDMAGSGLDYLRAQRELQYRQILYELLLKQFDAARLDEAKYATVIQVVEPATPPDQKSDPHRAVITLQFTLVGLLIACCWVFADDYLKRNQDVGGRLKNLRIAFIGR